MDEQQNGAYDEHLESQGEIASPSPHGTPTGPQYSAAQGDAAATVSQVNPWSRFLARSIDQLLFLLTVSVLFIFIFPQILELPGILFGMVFLFLMTFPEALFISKWSATPGKQLLKIKVLTPSKELLSYSDAWKRSVGVYLNGIGLGIPFVSIVTMILSYRQLTNNSITKWDEAGGFKVIHEKPGPLRITIVILLISCFLFMTFYESVD